MNTTKTLTLATLLAATFISHSNIFAAGLDNIAIASSPRAREEFPELARSDSRLVAPGQGDALALSKIEPNAALASSPRVREAFPELSRPGVSPSTSLSAVLVGPTELDRVLQNEALAKSPRALEQYPELNRCLLSVEVKPSSPTLAHN
jgi:hypothetical protein